MKTRAHVMLAVGLVVVWSGSPLIAGNHTAADLLARLSTLTGAAHLEALERGARTEGGRVVWLVGRNLAEVTQLVEAFRVRYSFMSVEFVRAGEGSAQRILSEFRAGTTTADVLDLNAADTFILRQAGALVPYASDGTAPVVPWGPKTTSTRLPRPLSAC